MRLAALAGAALTAGCAGQPQTAPVYRDSTPTVPPPAETVVREEFDPARFREDLLLIEPVFPPPEVTAAAAPATLTPEPGTTTPAEPVVAATPGPLAGPMVLHRVQVIALTSQERAANIAAELQRRFDVPTDVVPIGAVFAVRAGGEPTRARAEDLRLRIAALSRAYESAFLVTEQVPSEADGSAPDGPLADLPTATEAAVDDTSAVPTVADSADTTAPEDLPVFVLDEEPEPELVLVHGYRVLLGQFLDLRSAQEDLGRVMNRLKREDVDVKFEAPWYKVLAGSFRTQSAAQHFAERCRNLGYRTAAPVRGDVFLPKEEGSDR